MKAADLRKSILQAAVQGKLVPQDKNDEPASELLKRIQAEKAALIKEGKLKKEKNLPPITEDEIPCDLPEGWIWCRVGAFSYQVTSGSREWAKYYSSDGAKFLRMGNLSKDSYELRLSNIQHVCPPKGKEGERTSLQENDILVSITGDVGLLGMIPTNFGEAYINQHVAMVRCSQYVIPVFIAKAFLSPLCINQFNEPQRGIKNSFRLTDLLYMLVPLPPLAEQQRIVAKVDEIMALCDELEAAEKELDTLENHFAEYLPKSILQVAVQGKLVLQDKSDEAASELLKRIKAEKAALIKEGKLKKEKLLPPITEQEIAYDLPDGWVWCRLGELVQLISGRDLEPHAYNDQNKGIPYITGASAIINSKIDVVRWTEYPVVISSSGDILLSCKGTVGKIIHNTIGDCHIARQIMAIRIPVPEVDSHYLALALETFVTQLATQAKSMIPGISREDVLYLVYPLPPLAEQKRIVAKVYELMALCNELKHVGEQPIDHNEMIQFPAEAELETEPLQMAAQGKVFEQPSKKHATALNDLVEMMDDE